MATQTIKIFISSPGDVGQERLIATRTIERLQGEFAAYAELLPILWEHEPLRATAHFQEQILPPSQTDIVVCILWSRLGTRLPSDKFAREDGTAYASGTEWEFEDAVQAFLKRGTPDLMVYRKTSEAVSSLADEDALLGRLQQKKALDSFIERWFGSAQSTFRAAFHTFAAPDQFEELIESHLRQLIRERLPQYLEEGSEKTPILWHKGSPFRGLEAFDVEHAPVFFGRTRAIGETKDALVARAASGCAFLLVFGMSGSGKSSLVRAGLLPTLIQPGVVEGIGLWRWSILRPSDAAGDLFHGLALALLGTNALPEMGDDGLDVVELAAFCRESPQRVVGLIRSGLKRAATAEAAREQLTAPPATRLALVIDQMEEIFTQEHLSGEARVAFVAVLAALAQSGLVWIIGTMRSDFYPRCAEVPNLAALKEQGAQYDLLPPSFTEIRQMISQPTRAAGLRFEVEPTSGESLGDALHEAASHDPEGLPLLEFTLDALYHERTENGVLTFESYQKLGGLEGALAQRAENVFLELEPSAQKVLPEVLRMLVTVEESGNRVARRRVRIADLAISPERKTLIEAFINARLFVVDRADEGEAVVGVAHETLLQHWPRLQSWLADDREFLLQRERMGSAATLWKKEGQTHDFLLHQGKALAEAKDILARRRSELDDNLVQFIETSQRRVTSLRRRKIGTISAVAAAFFLVISGFGLTSYLQWQRAEKQKNLALAAINTWTRDIPDKLRDVPGTLPVLREIFQKNVGVLDAILQLSPNTPQAMREKALNYRHSGDTWRVLGATQSALEAYDKSLDILNGIAQNDNSFQARRDLATIHERIGDTRFEIGDLAGATDSYQKDLDLTVALAKERDDSQTRSDLSVSTEKIGDVLWQKGDKTKALETYQRSLALRLELAKDKTNLNAQRNLFVSYEKLGTIYLALGNGKRALQEYQTSLALRIALAKAHPKDLELQRDLAVGYVDMGAIRLQLGDGAGAMQNYRLAHQILQYQARDRFSVRAQLGLAESYNRIGDLYQALGDNPKALQSYRQSIAVTREVAQDKTNIQARKYLVESYARLVWVALLDRRPQEAQAAALEALRLDPTQNEIKVNLAHAYLFSNQVDKAIALYLKNEAVPVNATQTFGDVALADFKQFKSLGLTHPRMDEIAHLISEARKLP